MKTNYTTAPAFVLPSERKHLGPGGGGGVMGPGEKELKTGRMSGRDTVERCVWLAEKPGLTFHTARH